MSQTKYYIEAENQEAVWITDISQGLSVTNEISAVVKELHDSGILQGRKLFYYDTFGKLDEILHDGKGKYLSIRPLGEKPKP